MKIALCLSGQPRYIDIAFPYLKQNVIDKNDCDIFFHTWFDKGKEYDGTYWSPKITPDNNIPQKLLDLYKPKKYIIEPNRNEQFKQESINIRKNTEAEPYITKSMFYTIKKSNDIKLEYEKQNNIHYDITIRARFDVAILSPLVIGQGESFGTINYVDVIRNPKVPCDWCFWGDSKTMNISMNVYNYLQEYADKGEQVCGESMLQRHINENGFTKRGHQISAVLIRDSELKDKSWGKIY